MLRILLVHPTKAYTQNELVWIMISSIKVATLTSQSEGTESPAHAPQEKVEMILDIRGSQPHYKSPPWPHISCKT